MSDTRTDRRSTRFPENSQKGRWTLGLGTSRLRTPPPLAVDPIDMFIHDSLRTGRNVEFELNFARRHLRPNGVMRADDLH